MVAAAAVMLTGAACSSGEADDAGKPSADTKLVIGDQVKLTQSLLESSGELKDIPYEVEWASFEAGPPLLEAASAGKIDFGGTGDVPALFAQSAGSPLKIVATSTKPSVGDYLLVKPDSPIKTVEDLKGEKVAFTKGSSSNGLVIGLLDQAGLKPDDIEQTYLTPNEGLAAFTSGQVDAWAVWNPFAIVAQKQGARVVGDGTGLTTQQSYYLASDKALNDGAKNAALKDFVGRLVRAQKWALGNKDKWVPVFSKLTTLPEDVASKTFDESSGEYVPIADTVIAKQQKLIDLFSGAGVIPNKPTAKDYFDERYNSEVTAGADS